MLNNNISLLEKAFIKTGTVLDVRAWKPATFFEVDVHLPQLNMQGWMATQHIKCKVGNFTYRDYTPAYWDAETHTCTLFIDAAHDGAGSRWVKTLQQGSTLYYLGAAGSHQQASAGATNVMLGDQTAIGHFAALQQLAGPQSNIAGAVVIREPEHHNLFNEYLYRLPVTPVTNINNWLQSAGEFINPVFYLVGNSHMVVNLRKQLKALGYGNNQVKAQGFWR